MAMAMMTKIEGVLDALIDTLPALLTSNGLAPDSCVAATRIACLALGEIGMKASPLPCRVQAYSPRYWQALRDGEVQDRHPETVARLGAEGAWLVEIGHPANEGIPRPDGSRGYNAHLLCLVERRWAVDLTIHQANRPAKAMLFDPHYFAVTPEFMAGDPMTFATDEGARLVYVRVDNNTYAVVPDWTNVRRTDRLVRSVTSRLAKATA